MFRLVDVQPYTVNVFRVGSRGALATLTMLFRDDFLLPTRMAVESLIDPILVALQAYAHRSVRNIASVRRRDRT